MKRMLKWYEQVLMEPGNNYISSRIRIARNWNEYNFPNKLDVIKGQELVERLEYGLKDIGEAEGEKFLSTTLDKIPETERMAMRERRVINSAIADKKTPTGLMLSESEDISLVFNGDDHIRMQIMAPNQKLQKIWERADSLDDYINERFNYAFDEKYGYLTAFPTNVGTGMRANIVVHLPALSSGKQFSNLISGMTRFGVAIRGVYGEGRENYGSLYDISNSKTLGMSEKEIVDLVQKVASQLNSQENQVRQMSLNQHRLERTDEACKSYGLLKYARKLSLKDALTFVSQVMAGISDGIIETKTPCSLYRLVFGMQPSNLINQADKPVAREMLDVLRADYIRKELPELKEL
jgi:protein arginine kinase